MCAERIGVGWGGVGLLPRESVLFYRSLFVVWFYGEAFFLSKNAFLFFVVFKGNQEENYIFLGVPLQEGTPICGQSELWRMSL